MAYKTIQELKTGDTVWYTNADPRTKDKLLTATVTKITSRSIYISRNQPYGAEIRIDKKTLKNYDGFGYGYTVQVYLDSKKFYDDYEYEKLRTDIIKLFQRNKGKISLHKMRMLFEQLNQAEESSWQQND